MMPARAWVRLESGRRLNLLEPDPASWLDTDLAIGLSRTYRWGGHSCWDLPLSVVQHSLLVLVLRQKLRPLQPLNRADALRELLHDADEGLLSYDPISPIKPYLGPHFRALAGRMQSAVQTRCGLQPWDNETRKRFLLMARHQAKVPPFLYEPPKRPLRAVGDVLGRLPLAGDIERAGPMHRVPSLQWRTWVRLAFVEAGSDWRSLNRLRVEDGQLTDFRLMPDIDWHAGVLGARAWEAHANTATGHARPGTGSYSIADPRRDEGVAAFGQYGVKAWRQPSQTVIGKAAVGAGGFAVADPRHSGPEKFNNVYRVIAWDRHAAAVTSSWDVAVADPRPNLRREKGADWAGAGHYGVVQWHQSSGAVSSAAGYDNGRFSVADPRLPAATDRLVAVIRSTDGTWHRPFTTLELAALQSLVDPEEQLELDGLSDADWRERIGNAVPPDAAAAIASTMATTLLLAWSGEGFMLSAVPIWVRPVATALSVRQAEER